MGQYFYLCCRSCKKTVCMGRTNTPDIQSPEVVKKFIHDHIFLDKHHLFVVMEIDSGLGTNPELNRADALYCEVMEWEELNPE